MSEAGLQAGPLGAGIGEAEIGEAGRRGLHDAHFVQVIEGLVGEPSTEAPKLEIEYDGGKIAPGAFLERDIGGAATRLVVGAERRVATKAFAKVIDIAEPYPGSYFLRMHIEGAGQDIAMSRSDLLRQGWKRSEPPPAPEYEPPTDLKGDELELLRQLFVDGPTLSIDLQAEGARDSLLERGFIDHQDDWHFVTQRGVYAAILIGMDDFKRLSTTKAVRTPTPPGEIRAQVAADDGPEAAVGEEAAWRAAMEEGMHAMEDGNKAFAQEVTRRLKSLEDYRQRQERDAETAERNRTFLGRLLPR